MKTKCADNFIQSKRHKRFNLDTVKSNIFASPNFRLFASKTLGQIFAVFNFLGLLYPQKYAFRRSFSMVESWDFPYFIWKINSSFSLVLSCT